RAEDALITLESEKATMDVPAPVSGVVQALSVKAGDRVSEGSLILTLLPEAGSPAVQTAAAAPPAAASAPAPQP
ncbi:MAG TPA: hypothetical protein DHV08_05925, partial [Rhodocyclaceae bacterium]|nr:hypothetical protein [Rhodocyclaceae bacterium]